MHLARWGSDLVTLLCLMSTVEVPSWATELHFISAPRNTTVKLDQNFAFKCIVSAATKRVIKWYYNGDELSHRGENYRIRKNGTRLRFTQVKVANRGWYHCRVVDEVFGSFESPKALLTVHAPAVIMNRQHIERPREESIDSVLYISCKAAGIPPPVVEWRRNGNLIPKNQSNPHEVQTEHGTSPVSLTSTLRIIVSQSANYSCRAVNLPLGKLSSDSVSISIKVKPTAGM
ncbi:hypothetical protein BsWGS_19360 [Bradybaena similaris]